MKRMKGFTLIELLIVVAIIAILAAIAVPNFLEAQVRSKVSRVRTDHRSMATAIEAYYVDNNSYPASTNVGTHSAYAQFQATGKLQNCLTFKMRFPTFSPMLQTLTTPIAYITSYFPDAFADTKGATFPYWSTRSGWILGSWGPDTDQGTGGQLNWCTSTFVVIRGSAVNPVGTGVETVYDPVNESQPSQTLIAGSPTTGAYTYDPTNGTVSAGDLWRVKQ